MTDKISLRSATTQRYEPLTTLLKFGCLSHAEHKAWNSLSHARAAVIWKDWSQMVRSRVLGTIRRCWEPDRSRRIYCASSVALYSTEPELLLIEVLQYGNMEFLAMLNYWNWWPS